ncbi:aryl-alcohol-oxidase from pleurotus Eryingii [Marasmius fiardii PR-910]|nr:aryl-alcohol-oxidase from pleurotus Eryingii [Marasmius fiardii PR-910]
MSGGTAGLVVANRLSENPNVSILVIEAGVSNKDGVNVSNIQVPFFCTRAAPRTLYDWNYTTVPQAQLNGRSVDYNRGHVLGGSSSINNMAYTRGSSEDYDRIANVTGDKGWSWKNLQPFILRNEVVTPPADHHNTTGQYIPAVHGHSGVNSDSLPGFPTPIDARVLRTTQELPEEFPFNMDYNSGFHLGIGWSIATIRHGERSSSATSYLGPKYVSRPNLHVVLNTRVTRVLSSNTTARSSTTKGVPIDTVEVATSANGPRKLITAKKEIVLSAGSIGSPQILMNSGIGDSNALTNLGIKTVLHNPSVGQNLTDHPILRHSWFVNETKTWEKITRNATFAQQVLDLWKTKRQGPLVNNLATQTGWFRIPDDSPAFEQHPDTSAGPNTAHFELLFGNGMAGIPPPEGNFFTISTAVVAPASRGSVQLHSNDPFDPPLIDPNFYGSEFDMTAMKEAITAARRFAAAKAWDGYILKPFFNDTTEAEIEVMIRATTSSIFHPVGTVAMSARNADYGVVDPDMKVKGVSGLRVIDASVFPYIPAAHTQVPVYILAERGSQLIQDSWQL